MSGRHRPGSPADVDHHATRSALSSRPLRVSIAIGAVAALVAVTAVAVRAVAADAGGCSNGIRLTIAAAPDIAPVVTAAAARWASSDPEVNGKCVRAQVDAVAPVDMANSLAALVGARLAAGGSPAPTPAESALPTVWIADSSAWIGRTQAFSRDAFSPDIRSVARSPVVLAVPEAAVSQLAGGTRSLSVQQLTTLLGRLATDRTMKIGITDPRRDSAGLAAAMLLHEVIAINPERLPVLVGAYRRLSIAPDAAALRTQLGGPVTLAAMTEQAVIAGGGGGKRIVAVPVETPKELDYPYAVLNGKSRAAARAADMFQAALTSSAYKDLFFKAGFRSADGSTGAGFPSAPGVSPEPVVALPLTDLNQVNQVLGIWSGAVSPSRVLALVDVTSSMSEPMGPLTRLQVLRQAATEGLGLFTDDSEMGLWAFAAGLSGNRDYVERVPVGKLTGDQRGRLLATVNGAAAVGTDVCGLYESILAAIKSMQAGYRPEASNTIVVFTDGGNTKPGMSLDDMLRELETLADVTKPMRVILLGLGPTANLEELNEIARATGGQSHRVSDPREISAIFLRALLRA